MTYAKSKRIQISFKNTKKELKLYNYIANLQKQEKSEFAKKAMFYYLKNVINNNYNKEDISE